MNGRGAYEALSIPKEGIIDCWWRAVQFFSGIDTGNLPMLQ